jgi:hypothetical protein
MKQDPAVAYRGGVELTLPQAVVPERDRKAGIAKKTCVILTFLSVLLGLAGFTFRQVNEGPSVGRSRSKVITPSLRTP